MTAPALTTAPHGQDGDTRDQHDGLRLLHWHVHGSWTTALVQGRHTCLLPTLPERGPWGGGRPAAWDWPQRARETSPEELRAGADAIDVVVLQRWEEIELTERWTGRRPGVDLPAVWVEHNTPRGDAPTTRHPLADRDDIPIVHVTHFNALMWDSGRAPVHVVEHGVPDPGARYTGEIDRAAVVVNEPVRRHRVTGTDLLPGFADTVGLDVFGIGTDRLDAALDAGAGQDRRRPDVRVVGDLPQARMHAELARRRVYLHPVRWTSLGLSLIEAMMLGMPVVGLATAEAAVAVPPEAGVVATDLDVLHRALRAFRADPDLARETGRRAREVATTRHSLTRFLSSFDAVLRTVVDGRADVPSAVRSS